MTAEGPRYQCACTLPPPPHTPNINCSAVGACGVVGHYLAWNSFHTPPSEVEPPLPHSEAGARRLTSVDGTGSFPMAAILVRMSS